MAKLTFSHPEPQQVTPMQQETVEERPVYDYSPKFNVEKANQMDAVIHALKLSQQPEQDPIDAKISKYQKIIGLLRSLK